MKTKSDRWQAAGGRQTAATREVCSCHASRVTRHPSAFTLIELLVVISIIAVLAAFTITVAGVVKKKEYVSETQAEMGKLKNAIDGYHDKFGFYPPGNPNDVKTPPLYYELMGTTINAANNYVTLDGSGQAIPTTSVINGFGVNGFVNCTRGSGDDATPAQSFLSNLKPQQIGTISNGSPATVVTILVGSAGGPDANDTYPFGATGLNPWRYACPGTNNPGSYDLWMQLVISGKTNLVCNWSSQVQINYPLP